MFQTYQNLLYLQLAYNTKWKFSISFGNRSDKGWTLLSCKKIFVPRSSEDEEEVQFITQWTEKVDVPQETFLNSVTKSNTGTYASSH